MKLNLSQLGTLKVSRLRNRSVNPYFWVFYAFSLSLRSSRFLTLKVLPCTLKRLTARIIFFFVCVCY